MKHLYLLIVLFIVRNPTNAQNNINTKEKLSCTTDADRDGIPDCKDKCPETPNGARVDVTGCMKDTDGDGVMDFYDKQLITPTECQPADADGFGKCPKQPIAPGIMECGGPYNSHFGTYLLKFKPNSNILSEESKKIMDNACSFLRGDLRCKIKLTYCLTGKQSIQQLQSVLDYFVKIQNIDNERIRVITETENCNPNEIVLEN